MARVATRRKKEEVADSLFLGTKYSNQECAFLIEHLGKPSILACPEGQELPEGVNPAAVVPILDRTYQLAILENATREKYPDVEGLKVWVGFDRLREILQLTLDNRAMIRELKDRTRGSAAELRRAAAAPSLHLWDPDTDVPYLGGIGADADIVQTALGPNGQRIPLSTTLKSQGVGAIQSLAGVAKFLKSQKPGDPTEKLLARTPNQLQVEPTSDTTSIVKCPVCGVSESFENNKPHAKRKAMDKIIAHLEHAETKPQPHRLLLKRIQSGRAGLGEAVQQAESV